MPVLDWFRPPRYVLTLCLLVTLAGILAMGWLGWELLDRERLVEKQRALEGFESAADRAVSLFQREIAALERFLSMDPASAFPEATVAFTADGRGFRVQPVGGIVYFPALKEDNAKAEDAFRPAESLEYASGGADRAIALYKELAASSDPAIRAGALLRLGRMFRKANRMNEALRAYSTLAALGPVRTAGLPAALLGRQARATALAQQSLAGPLANEARELCGELASGRWQIPRGAWFFLREEAQSWLPAGSTCAPVAETALSASAEMGALWGRWASLPATGRALSTAGGKPILSVWASTPERLSAVLAGAPYLETMARRVSDEIRMPLALSDDRDRPVVSQFRGEAHPLAARKAAASNLPWNIQLAAVGDRKDTAEFQVRRRMLLGGFGLASLLLLAGGYFTFRGIYRELAVAQLQSDFVSAVSHEFRTPLTTLRQFSEMLARGRLVNEERRQRYYEAMVAESGRLHRLVEELLDFGRMEAGAMLYRRDPLDAGELVQSVSRDFERQLENGRVELAVPESPYLLRGDREALSLALWNLLDNAFKYSPGCRTVQVEVARNGRRVAIAVKDHGVGIAPQDRSRIFRKFVRGAGAMASGEKGTGIGLAILQHVIKAHGGEVRLESEPGQGSTFTLLLPSGES